MAPVRFYGGKTKLPPDCSRECLGVLPPPPPPSSSSFLPSPARVYFATRRFVAGRITDRAFFLFQVSVSCDDSSRDRSIDRSNSSGKPRALAHGGECSQLIGAAHAAASDNVERG